MACRAYNWLVSALLLTALAISSAASAAPTATPTAVASVSASVAATNVLRIGLNMDQQASSDSRAYLANYLENPGFEPEMVGHVIIVAGSPAPTASTFTDSNDLYFTATTGYWNTQSLTVRTGVCAGDILGGITYVAGGSYSYSTCTNAGGSCSCTGLASGDLLGETIQNLSIGFRSGHWLPGFWTINNGDTGIQLSSIHEGGQSSAQFDISDGNSHSISFSGDSGGWSVGTCSSNKVTFCQTNSDCSGVGGTCQGVGGSTNNTYPLHPFVNVMVMTAWAKTPVGVADKLTLSVSRVSGSWGTAGHVFTTATDGLWHQYIYPFTGADGSTDTGTWTFTVALKGNSPLANNLAYVDEVYLGSSLGGGAGSFRPDVINTLKTLKPGTLRYMIPPTLTQNDTNFEASDFLKGPTNDYDPALTPTNPGPTEWFFSPADMYAAAGYLGAAPWVSIPDVFSDADVTSFATNLCNAFEASTAGNTQPGWNTAFIEQGNEDWTSSSHSAGGGHTSQYGALANRNFGIIEAYRAANCPSLTPNYVVNGQEANAGVLQNTSAQIPTNNAFFGGEVAAYVPAEDFQLTGQTDLQYATLGFNNALNQFKTGVESNVFTNAVPSNIVQLCGNNLTGCQQFMAIYENGSSNQCGNGTTPIEAYKMSAGWMAAGANGLDWLLGFQAGSTGLQSGTLRPFLAQNVFNFAEPEFTTSAAACNGFCTGSGTPYGCCTSNGHGTCTGTTSALWGIVHDFDSSFGPSSFPHMRPIGWAMKVANDAIGGDYHATSMSGIGGVYTSSFLMGSDWDSLIVNTNNFPVSYSITYPNNVVPGPTETVLFTNGITDNDEDSNSVTVGPVPGGLNCVGMTCTMVLPAQSVNAADPAATPTPTATVSPTPSPVPTANACGCLQ